MRAIFAPGTWQVVSAAAAMATHHDEETGRREDVLVLYGHGTPDFKTMMQRIALSVWPWKKIVWADDVLLAHFPTRKFAPVVTEVLRERVGGNVNEIWISKLYTDPGKLAVHAFPRSKLFVFEDGAEEFIEQEVTCGWRRMRNLPIRRRPGALGREFSHLFGRAPECLAIIGCCDRQRKRISAIYSGLAASFPLPEHYRDRVVVRIETATLRERLLALREMARADNELAEVHDRSAVLFLPQPFYEARGLTGEDEFQLYRDAIRMILQKGYRVLWKEHPRQRSSFLSRLISDIDNSNLKAVQTAQAYPVECLAGGWELAAVAGVCSSALIYLNALYGFPIYTAAGLIPPDRWRRDVERKLTPLFLRHVPGLHELGEIGG